MSNQLTDLFNMTGTSDVPDAAIEAVTKAWGLRWSQSSVRRDANRHTDRGFTCRILIALARHIAREHPEWIEDPDLATVRELWAKHEETERACLAEVIRARKYDDSPGMRCRLAAFKAGRAAERAGQ